MDFLVFGVGDEVEASRSLGDNGWAPSVGVWGPFSQGTRADVRAAEHTFQLGSTGLRMRAARKPQEHLKTWHSLPRIGVV